MKRMVLKFTFLLICSLVLLGFTKADNRLLGTRTVAEGNVVTFTVSATDPDGDVVTLSVEALPAGATFSTTTENGGVYSSTFNWTPGYNDAGVIDVWIIATDALGAQDWGKATITVNNTNRPPILGDI